jgi:eukaryotic-like serine/threonine-protein kinase
MATPRQSAEQLFGAALELTPQERPTFLNEACRDNPQLRHLVEELLLEDERAGSFLEKPLFHFKGNGAGDDATSSKLDSSDSNCRNGLGPMHGNRFKPGESLGDRFIIVRFIAQGGMGEVYEVEDRFLPSEHIALKVILQQYSTDLETQHRFEQEILLARKLTHPNLCPIYDIFHCDEPAPPFSFLTMRLLPGETLAARLAQKGPLPPEEAISICRQMTAGLAAIHAAGIIHRDIKPNNVMLDGEGLDLRVCITDFGLARLHQAEATLLTKGMVAGTRGYMAPELLLGQLPSQATDIFAFGIVLHEILTGVKPHVHAGNFTAVASPHLKSAEVPSELAQLVVQFIANDPKRRFLAFKQAQQLFISKPSRSSLTYSAPAFWTRRRFAFAAAVGTVAVAGGIRWKWDQLDDLLHPLPVKRFVALLNWPPTSDLQTKSMLAGVIDAIGNELARAEAFDRNLFVISRDVGPGTKTTTQLNDLRDRLGANLVLAASGVPHPKQFQLSLRVLDPSSTRSLREKQISLPLSEQLSFPAKAVRAAAQLLDISHYQTDHRRTMPDTQSPEAYAAFQAAETLMKQPNDTGLEAAIETYTQAVNLDPRYATAYAKLAMAYFRLYVLHSDTAALSLARSNCNKALTLNPGLVEARLALSSVMEYTGDKDGAAHEIEKALAIDPVNPRTLVYQGQLYSRLNRWSEAEETFDRVLKLRPNFWLAHNELGIVFNLQGKYSQSMAEFGAASLAAPKNALALNNIGDVYLRQGKVVEAKDAVAKSAALHASDLAAITMAAALRSEGKYADAIRFAEKAVELNPAQSAGWLELGDCYSLVRGHRGEAERAYAKGAESQEEGLRTDPTNGPGWMLLALCRTKSGAPETALALIKKAEQSPADDIDSQLFKARTLELLGRRDEALATVAACLKRGATQFQIQSMPDMGPLRADLRYHEISKSSVSTTEVKPNP